MDNIIASWICLDDEISGTYFPSARGKSSDSKVQQIYYRCICCFFTMARYFNPGARLVLFSNSSTLPNVEGTDVQQVLKRLRVEFYTTAFEYVTPENYFKQWRNQFYEFSIFKFISEHPAFNDEDRFLLLDSDCIITDNLSILFDTIEDEKCITYIIDYAVEHEINGNSRLSMKEVFSELSNCRLDGVPEYHGGEIYASTIAVTKQLMQDFYKLWPQLLERHYNSKNKLHEEAHVLSYLFFKNGFAGGQANQFIKRLWTDPSSYRNVEKYDADLPIWHLPAEKRFGFKKLFQWLQDTNFNLQDIHEAFLLRKLRRIFLVAEITLRSKLFFAGKSFIKKIIVKA